MPIALLWYIPFFDRLLVFLGLKPLSCSKRDLTLTLGRLFSILIILAWPVSLFFLNFSAVDRLVVMTGYFALNKPHNCFISTSYKKIFFYVWDFTYSSHNLLLFFSTFYLVYLTKHWISLIHYCNLIFASWLLLFFCEFRKLCHFLLIDKVYYIPTPLKILNYIRLLLIIFKAVAISQSEK